MTGRTGSDLAVPDEIRPVFDAVFDKKRVSTKGQWITLAPWSQWKSRLEHWEYFCGLCDSTVTDNEIVTASLRRSRIGRRQIEGHGVHWQHDFEDVGLSSSRSFAESVVRPHLEAGPVAVTWDIAEQKLLIVHGRKVPRRA